MSLMVFKTASTMVGTDIVLNQNRPALIISSTSWFSCLIIWSREESCGLSFSAYPTTGKDSVMVAYVMKPSREEYFSKKLSPPSIAKPQVACGVSDAHSMFEHVGSQAHW